MFVFDGAVAFCGETRFGLTVFVFNRAGRRWHHDQSIHARVRCRLEQRRCDGCFGLCKKWLRHGDFRLRERLIAGGAGEGSLLRDAWFAVAFLCAVEQRRVVVLGR